VRVDLHGQLKQGPFVWVSTVNAGVQPALLPAGDKPAYLHDQCGATQIGMDGACHLAGAPFELVCMCTPLPQPCFKARTRALAPV
jgi:hypothetical protein